MPKNITEVLYNVTVGADHGTETNPETQEVTPVVALFIRDNPGSTPDPTTRIVHLNKEVAEALAAQIRDVPVIETATLADIPSLEKRRRK